MDQLPEDTVRIVRQESCIIFNRYYKWLVRWSDPRDIEQFIYARLYQYKLLKCKDGALIRTAARRASWDFLRRSINGFRRKGKNKRLTPLDNVINYCNAFDNENLDEENYCVYDFQKEHNTYILRMTLNSLLNKLPDKHKHIVRLIFEGYTHKEIGEMLNVTQFRISQIRAEIIQSLINLEKGVE